MRLARTVFTLLTLTLLTSPAPRARAAAVDGAIDTAHVSHVAWQDRQPLCPVDRQPFAVRLRALRDDLSSVRVRFVDGGDGGWIAAQRTGPRGAYDLWRAALPAAGGTSASYYFELADGAARAWLGPAGVGAAPPADSGFALDFATLAHAPHGATPLPGGGTVFKVWAPGVSLASVRGDFNAWGLTAMQRVGQDFVARVPNAAAPQAYKYFFPETNQWSVDARGRVLDPAGGYWNSWIADPTAFSWTDSAWRTPPLEQLVIYQLNVGTFCGRNDPHGATPFPSRFADVAARASELAALGVNAVMLNPVASTPVETYAGYSTLTPWSPQFEYGMPDDFKGLVDALHREGIAVLCDIVWNHVDPGTQLLWNYDGTQEYFENPHTDTPWGPQAAFGRAGVDAYYLDSALHWLEEYHVDGFRMDAVAYMAIDPHAPQGWSLMQRFNDEVERRAADAIRIAEEFPLTGSVVMPTALAGAGFDAQYNGDFRSYLRYSIPQPSGFYYFGYAAPLFSAFPGLSSARQSFNYFELHDDAWDNNGHHRFLKDLAPTPGVVGDTARARLGVATGLLMLAPGVPALLMGDEWADTTSWGTAPANRIDWAGRTLNAGYYAMVRDLVAMRKSLPALRADAPSVPTHSNFADGVFGWLRYDSTGRMYLSVVNLGDRDFPSYLIGAPAAGSWTERFNSQAAAYGGTGLVNALPVTAFARQQDGYPRTLDIRLPRSSVVVLQALNTTGAGAPDAPLPLRFVRVWPNPARGGMRARFELPRAGRIDLEVLDLQGRRVVTLAGGELAAGAHEAAWDGNAEGGRPAAPGIYLMRLRTGAGETSRRVVVLR